MNEGYFKSSIRKTLNFLEQACLDEVVVNLSSLKVNQKFNEIALNSASSYQKIYRSALNLSHFNFQLTDFALLQFSWESEESWRLAYYPNPWFTGVPQARKGLNELREYLSAGALNSEEFSELVATDFEFRNSVPMFRYEYSKKQYKEIIHPISHFHIGAYGGDRWALRRKLSPLSFTMLIVRMYYPDVWLPHSSFSNDGVADCWEQMLNNSLHHDGFSAEFTENEKVSMHIGSHL